MLNSSESFNTFQLTGQKMNNFLPENFNVFALHAFQATQQPDGLQVPAQWIELIEALPLLSDRYHYHLFQLHERCLEMILCSVARVLLAILTRWPTTPTKTMEQTRSYYKQAVWNPDGMAIDQIPWKKIFLMAFRRSSVIKRSSL